MGNSFTVKIAKKIPRVHLCTHCPHRVKTINYRLSHLKVNRATSHQRLSGVFCGVLFAVSPLLCCLRNWWIWNIQFDCSRIWIKRIWKVTNISNIRIRIIENTQKQFDVKKNLWLLFWDFYIFDINRPYQMSIPPTRYFALIKEHITPQNTPESRWWEVARLTFKWDKR